MSGHAGQFDVDLLVYAACSAGMPDRVIRNLLIGDHELPGSREMLEFAIGNWIKPGHDNWQATRH